MVSVSFCVPVEGQRSEKGGEIKGVVNKWQTCVQKRISLKLTSYYFLHSLLGPLLCTWTLSSPSHLCWCSSLPYCGVLPLPCTQQIPLSSAPLHMEFPLPGPLLLPPASPDGFKSHSSVPSQAREAALDPLALGSCPAICSHSSLGSPHCSITT